MFIPLAVIASETREMSRNSKRIWPYNSSRSSKVIDLGVNGKPICDFLLVVTLAASRYSGLKIEKLLIFTLGVNPLECRDEILHQNTRIEGLPESEDTLPARDGKMDGRTRCCRKDQR